MELYYNLWNCTATSTQSDIPRIVLLHGMGGTGALWRPIGAALEDTWAVLAPDQRGHGRSQIRKAGASDAQMNESYLPLDYGQDVIDTLASLKFYPTWIVGHSMGVRTALAAAHLKPDWFQGLVLVDLGLSGAAGGGLGETLEQFLNVLPKEFASREEARQFMAKNCPDPAIAQYLMAVSVRGSDGKISFPFDQQALIKTIQAAANSTVREWVKELADKGMPILILRGQESLVWSHKEFEAEKALFAESKSVRFEEVAGAGHGLPFEKRAVFVDLIRSFSGRGYKAPQITE
ncbi:MAG: alpha/beta hydrolase [Bdellovibrionia bacterium]